MYKLISSDSHIIEPADLWSAYIEPAFKARAPRLVREAEAESTFSRSREILDRLLKEVPDQEKARIAGQNAAALYRFE